MADLSESKALATPQAEKLSPEDLALRRQGIAAAAAMLSTITTIEDSCTDATYEASSIAAQDTVLRFLSAFSAQPSAAQTGFVFVLADSLFTQAEGASFAPEEYHSADHHANPPLSRAALCQAEESNRPHNGKALTPRERAALAQKWRAAFKRVNTDGPVPTTERQGRARFFRLMRELEHMNGNRESPKTSAKHVDATFAAAVTWPPAARHGFSELASVWLVDAALGISYSLDDAAPFWADPADEKHFAKLKKQRIAALSEQIKRADDKAKTRRARVTSPDASQAQA